MVFSLGLSIIYVYYCMVVRGLYGKIVSLIGLGNYRSEVWGGVRVEKSRRILEGKDVEGEFLNCVCLYFWVIFESYVGNRFRVV